MGSDSQYLTLTDQPHQLPDLPTCQYTVDRFVPDLGCWFLETLTPSTPVSIIKTVVSSVMSSVASQFYIDLDKEGVFFSFH